MYSWATDPNFGRMFPENVRLLTDADGETVTVAQITRAIREIIDAGVDQLIVYFAGHGVMTGMDEVWLLSEAPENGNEAINVSASARSAWVGATPHVVIISDACRVPSRSYETQALRAGSAFPNILRRNKRVDCFYSCAPAEVALETNTRRSRGIYSEILHDALCAVLRNVGGDEMAVLQSGDPEDGAKYIFPEPLGLYLELAVNVQLVAMNLDIDQSPTICTYGTTRDRRWLARFDNDGVTEHYQRRSADYGNDNFWNIPRGESRSSVRTISQTASDWIRAVNDGRPLTPLLNRAGRHGASALANSVERLIAAGPEGEVVDRVVVVGAEITRSIGLEEEAGGRSPRFAARSVILELNNGTAMVLPVLAAFRTVVILLDDGTPEVSFRPMYEIKGRGSERANSVRAIASAAARRGRFAVATAALTDNPIAGLSDPTLAVYAAHDHETRDAEGAIARIAENSHLQNDVNLFDLAARTGQLPGAVVPSVPMLIHGWDLPHTRTVMARSYVEHLRRAVRSTLWTSFDASAFDLLAEITV